MNKLEMNNVKVSITQKLRKYAKKLHKINVHNTGDVSQASWNSLAGTSHTAYMHAIDTAPAYQLLCRTYR